MNRCCCEATDRHFGAALVDDDLRRYEKQGPDKTTRLLLDALGRHELSGRALLDVGSGIGTIPLELCARGIAKAFLVDMASAYLAAAKAAAQRHGCLDRMTFLHGDLVQIGAHVPEADLVTLHRVVCCYPDASPLVRLSAAKARRWMALSYPRNHWYVRLGNRLKNWRRERQGELFRTYIHREEHLHRLLTDSGFRRIVGHRTLIWQVAIYEREQAA